LFGYGQWSLRGLLTYTVLQMDLHPFRSRILPNNLASKLRTWLFFYIFVTPELSLTVQLLMTSVVGNIVLQHWVLLP